MKLYQLIKDYIISFKKSKLISMRQSRKTININNYNTSFYTKFFV